MHVADKLTNIIWQQQRILSGAIDQVVKQAHGWKYWRRVWTLELSRDSARWLLLSTV
jgi:hypothetical protein